MEAATLLAPKELAEEWVEAQLGRVLDEGKDSGGGGGVGGRGGDAVLAEAAAWAALRVLQAAAMAPLRASVSPRVAEAFLRVLLVGQVILRNKAVGATRRGYIYLYGGRWGIFLFCLYWAGGECGECI